MANDELITISAAAELLGIHRQTLVSRIKRGDLEALRMPPSRTAPRGWRLLVKRSEVEALRPTLRPQRKGAGP